MLHSVLKNARNGMIGPCNTASIIKSPRRGLKWLERNLTYEKGTMCGVIECISLSLFYSQQPH